MLNVTGMLLCLSLVYDCECECLSGQIACCLSDDVEVQQHIAQSCAAGLANRSDI